MAECYQKSTFATILKWPTVGPAGRRCGNATIFLGFDSHPCALSVDNALRLQTHPERRILRSRWRSGVHGRSPNTGRKSTPLPWTHSRSKSSHKEASPHEDYPERLVWLVDHVCYGPASSAGCRGTPSVASAFTASSTVAPYFKQALGCTSILNRFSCWRW